MKRAMKEAVAFDAPVQQPNGQGGHYQGWDQQYVCRAGFTWLRGGETVLQGRLAGRKTVVVRIRNCAAGRTITPEWRMRDTRTAEVFNIRSILPSEDRLYIELTCETGVAV